MKNIFGEDKRSFIFQHGKAPHQCADITERFLKDLCINVLLWPAKSPDLEIIKNVWFHIEKQNRERFAWCSKEQRCT